MFIGPFMVFERIGKTACRLLLRDQLVCLQNVFHVSMLWKHLCDDDHIGVVDFLGLNLQLNISLEV